MDLHPYDTIHHNITRHDTLLSTLMYFKLLLTLLYLKLFLDCSHMENMWFERAHAKLKVSNIEQVVVIYYHM